MLLEELKSILSVIPDAPGCYRFWDAEGELIYVGKAKSLRKRISSYFRPDICDRKTRALVSRIANFTYTVVASEGEALLLENSLIKAHQPKYNLLLKDGKTYPSIAVRAERFPRIEVTRDIRKDGSRYFGPFPSPKIAYGMVGLIRELYSLRTCRLRMTPDDIAAGKYRLCLQYHIKRCLAPCRGLQSEADYDKGVEEAIEMLSGKTSSLAAGYRRRMAGAAKALRYEDAQLCKERLALLERYTAKYTVAPRRLDRIDVFALLSAGDLSCISYLHISEGFVSCAHVLECRQVLDEEVKGEVMASAITELRCRFSSDARELILPFEPFWHLAGEGLKITVPQKGDRKLLLDLAERNARQYLEDRIKQSEKLNPVQHTAKLLDRIKDDLHLPNRPCRIECFDNSNIQGSSPVASCVVFINGKPAKKEYRKFHVKTVEGADDFATMREIIRRRYHRLISEGLSLPDLIVVDGGKGQLNAGYSALEQLDIHRAVPIIGIAKRLEEIFYPHDPVPLIIEKSSSTLRVIQRLRDESHRFAITFHRAVRSKKQILSALDEIPGIGRKTKTALLDAFGSVRRIGLVDRDELAAIIGPSKAKAVYEALHCRA